MTRPSGFACSIGVAGRCVVPVDSYPIAQDANVNGHPGLPTFGPGPMEAIAKFLATHNEFVRSRQCERLLISFCPGGCLLRTR